MATLIYARRALEDLERIADFLGNTDTDAAELAIELIEEAIALLAHHPLVGRAAEEGYRELVISRGRTGYIALYRYRPRADVVVILAIRHQREAGYR
ncbi:MAG: type II toxin-antitoxin system RelE/ParE family toxin [Acidobacteriota bacterium]